MDTFMDKLVQRLNAQEVIKANTAAETAEIPRLKEQNALYEEILRQVKEEGEQSAQHVQRLEQGAAKAEQTAARLEEELDRMEQDTDKLGRSVLRTEQNMENLELSVAKVERGAEQIEQGAEKISQSFSMAAQSAEKIERGTAQMEEHVGRLEVAAARTERGAGDLEAAVVRAEHSADKLEQNTEKTEALIESGMAKFAEMQAAGQNTEELNALLNALKEAQAERFDQLTEHVHREDVRVYRNVQAVVIDEIAKQNEAAGKNSSSLSGKLGAVLGISIISLLVSAAGLAFQILVYLHII